MIFLVLKGIIGYVSRNLINYLGFKRFCEKEEYINKLSMLKGKKTFQYTYEHSNKVENYHYSITFFF